ncbi:pyocin immunity protein [Pseudomonas chlororaphis]|nr:pyocin immunity protein [Pseudomonas chlororaphis]
MNAVMIDDLVKSLGRTYPEMIASGMYLPDGPPKGIFEDSDTLAMSPEPGIELGFWAKSQRVEMLFISLLESFQGKSLYKGSLPYQLKSQMNQGWIRSRFGEPLESKAPFKMPIRGMTGGWDIYRFPSIPKGTQVVFKYSARMEVETIVFELNERSPA